jgi:hypothetical protein
MNIIQKLKTFCTGNLLCIYYPILTLLIIIYYFNNRSELTEEEYLKELQKINYNNIYEAENAYNQIEYNMNTYIKQKNGFRINKTQYEKEFINTQLSSNEKKLFQLYKKQNINSTIFKLIIFGYLVVPLIVNILNNGSIPLRFII